MMVAAQRPDGDPPHADLRRWDRCASELNALLTWWTVERRNVQGTARYRVSGKFEATDRVVRIQGQPGESLSRLIVRIRQRAAEQSLLPEP